MRKLSPEDIARLDGLLKTTEVVQRHTSFQEIKESPKKPSLTHLDAVLDHLKIAALAGHESLETTRRYCEPSPQDLQQAVEMVSEED